MNIAFFMDPKEECIYLYDSDSIEHAIDKMKESRHSYFVVLNKYQQVVNILSEGDLLYNINQEEIRLADIKSNKENGSITITASFDELVEAVMNQNIVPIVDDRNVFIGIVPRGKVISYLYDESKRGHNYGVMDTFAEMVKAGMKKIALAHPFTNKEERDSYIPFIQNICSNYGIHYYLDDTPLITDLFEKHLNYNTYNIIFYRNEEDINEYNYLKEYKYSKDYNEIRYEVAYRFGKLLSYSDETIQRYIDTNNEKEVL